MTRYCRRTMTNHSPSTAALCLQLNGCELLAGVADCVTTLLAAAAGQTDEATVARWLRNHSAAR